MSGDPGGDPDGGRESVRTAVPADLPALRAVYRAAALSNAGDRPLLVARPEFLGFGGEGVAEGRTRVAVVAENGTERIVGFATVADGADGVPDLEDLFVDPGRRRRGVARRLVEDVVATLRAAGHRRLTVVGNAHALGFYRAVGFVGDDREATPLGSGLRMSLDLDPAVGSASRPGDTATSES
jgi:GNAT superfamily N-acetyltransferase